MSMGDGQINEMVDNLYDYICEDTKLTWNSMYDKVRTIKGHKFLEQVDVTLKSGNRMPVLFPGENIHKDPVFFFFSIRPTQLHLNHVRRIQVD